MNQLARIRRSAFPDIIALLVCVLASLWGLLLLMQDEHFAGPTFLVTFRWAAPAVWGSVMLLSGILFALGVLVYRNAAWILALEVVALYCGWGVSVVLSYAPSGGMPPLLSFFVSSVCCALVWNYRSLSPAEERPLVGRL